MASAARFGVLKRPCREISSPRFVDRW